MIVLIIYFVLLGILIGSFLNVCIHRIPRKKSIVVNPSHCIHCGMKIKWYDLIPIISWLLLFGKCRNCKERISIRYPLVELLNGVLYLWIYLHIGFSIEMFFYCIATSVLIVISFIDFDYKIIPNSVLLFFLFAVFIYLFSVRIGIINAVIGFFAVSVPFLLISVIRPGAMGGGDIKMMAVFGLFLGWKYILLAVFIASLCSSFFYLTLILLKKAKKHDVIPFGPWLSIGIWISMMYGEELLSAYISLFF